MLVDRITSVGDTWTSNEQQRSVFFAVCPSLPVGYSICASFFISIKPTRMMAALLLLPIFRPSTKPAAASGSTGQSQIHKQGHEATAASR